MVIGFVVGTLSWFLVGTATTPTLVGIGVFLFGLADATQTPRFYDYVSSLAPSHQVGTFMGFAFLPVAIGAFGGGYLADWLRLTFIATNPSMMWYILSLIGFVGTVLVILHHLGYSKKTKTP